MMETETIDRIVNIDAWKWPFIEEELTKLGKIAKRLDVEPIVAVILERGVRSDINEGGVPYFIDTLTIRFDGQTPRLPGGWEFVGALEHLEAGNLVHGDDPVMSEWRDALNECAHCEKSRRRLKTVILRNEDGAVTQVGSTCLKDFLGYHGSPERLIAMLDRIDEFMGELDEEFVGGGWGRHDFGEPTDLFLSYVTACVRANGWAAKSQSYAIPTANLVGMKLSGYRPTKHESDLAQKLDAIVVEPVDVEEAAKVRAWAATIPADTPSDYLSNVRVALGGSVVLTKHYGIAASAISARRKEEEREEKRAVERQERAASEFVGEPGQRAEFAITVKFVRDIGSEWGDKFMVSMEDESGNRLKTFSTGSFGRYAKAGETAVIRATVKRHETYQGTKETLLTRVSVVDVEVQPTNREEGK